MKCVLTVKKGEHVEGATELHRLGYEIEIFPSMEKRAGLASMPFPYEATKGSSNTFSDSGENGSHDPSATEELIRFLRDPLYQKNDMVVFGESDVCPLLFSCRLEHALKRELEAHPETDIFLLAASGSPLSEDSFSKNDELYFQDGTTELLAAGECKRIPTMAVPARKRKKVADFLESVSCSQEMDLPTILFDEGLSIRMALHDLFRSLPQTPPSGNRKIAVVLPSYKRLPDLQRQIWCMMDQSYDNMHLFVAAKGISEGVWRRSVLPLFEHFIQEKRLTLRLCSNKNQLSNILDAVRGLDVSSYDLFVKIDDDDFYGRDYCQAINDFHRMLPMHFNSYYSGPGHYLSNREGFPVINAGCFHYFGPTLAFSHEVLEKLFACERDPQHIGAISPGARHAGYGFNEDNMMHIIMKETGCCNRMPHTRKLRLPMHLIIRNDNTSVMRGGLVSGDFWWRNVNISHGKEAEENILEIRHPQWNDLLRILGNRAKRLGLDNAADVLSMSETELVLKWDDWGTETFDKGKDGVFVRRSAASAKSSAERHKIAVLLIATGHETANVQACMDSCRKHFLNEYEVRYFLQTDRAVDEESPDVTIIHRKELPPALEKLNRFHLQPEWEKALEEYDFLYFIDSALRFRADVGKEIFPSDRQSLAVMYRPFWGHQSDGKGMHADSRFFGGRRLEVLHFCRELHEAIRCDLNNGFLANGFGNTYFNRCLKRKAVLRPETVQLFEPLAAARPDNMQHPNKTTMNHSRIIHVVHSSWQGECRIEGLRLSRMGENNDTALITEWDGDNPRALYWPRYNSVELLTWNPATDEFFATGRAGEWRAMSQAPSLTGAQYTVHEPSRTLMYLISKNACSTQIGTVLHELGYKPRQGSPSVVWDGDAYSHCRNNEDYDAEQYKDHIHMAVYHEPLARFVNLANYTWCIQKGQLNPFAHSCKTKRQFLDTLHLLIRMNKANHPGPFEQHLEGQAWYYDRCPRIDVVVRMEDLTDYMKTVMGVTPCNCNVDGKHELTMDDLTEEDVSNIWEEWADDFLLEERYAPFFWKNPNRQEHHA